MPAATGHLLCLSLLVLPLQVPAGGGPGKFERTLTLLGVSFRVSCPNDASVGTLSIIPSGLTADNSPITRTIDGTVTGAEVADLDGDGSPELYVYVTSAGSGAYGSLVAFSSNRKRSMSEIHLPPLPEGAAASTGYMGHDRFVVSGGHLVRRFPLYRPGDPNASPSGGTREVRYRLVAGEAGWHLSQAGFTDR